MDIAIIGSGKVGGVLAEGLANMDHQIFIATRNPDSQRVKQLCRHPYISAGDVAWATQNVTLIIVATPVDALPQVVPHFTDVKNKIIFDATNGVFAKNLTEKSSLHLIKKLSGSAHVVKCFNTVGYQLLNPRRTKPAYPVQMFTAGSCALSKEMALRVSQDLGFETCHDAGDDDAAVLLENMAALWVGLARINPDLAQKGWCLSPHQIK